MNILKELIEKASDDISTFKYPNIDECQSSLSKILTAAGYGSIVNDKIESLDIRKGILRIETTWYARGCSNSSDYDIPMSVIEAEDPIKAATIWGLTERINKAEHELANAQRSVIYAQETLTKLNSELEKVNQND
jgi:hypothetical protein